MTQELIGDTAAPVASGKALGVVPGIRAEGPHPDLISRRRVRLLPSLREIMSYRGMLFALTERDLRARYKQAALGFAWAIITPVMLMVVFTIVFTRFAHVDTGGAPYPLFAYLGLIPWTFFSSSVTGGGTSLISNMPLLNKVYSPREIYPLAGLALAAVDTLLAVLVLGALFGIYGYSPHVEIAWTPLMILVEVEFTLGVTLLLAALLIYVRDLRNALPLMLQLALFATPVAYGLSSLAGHRRTELIYAAINPLAPVIDGLRRTSLYGQSPDFVALGIGAASSTLLLAFAYWTFKRLETGMADIA
jgi:ABC-type polysaccharide/polyol phosphate export permease